MSSNTQNESEDESGMNDQGRPWHVRTYHRFFEGYSEVAVPKRKGEGIRIERVYTGHYFRQDLPPLQRIMIRVLYVALFMGAVALYASNAVLPLASNSTWYVTLPQAVSIPFLFWIVIAFYFYLPAARDMTIADYRSSSRSLLKATMGSAASLGAIALASLIFVVLNPSQEPLLELLCSAKYLAGGLMILGIHQIEKQVKYVQVPSHHQPPANSIQIN